MKKFVLDFLRRGLVGCGFGPLVLAIIYLVMRQSAALETLTVTQVCIGIFSTAALAFIAGGMNALYQLDRLPLMAAILIHGCVLYFSYLATYLLNDWLDRGSVPLIVFTAIFVAGYIVIWTVVYFIMKRRTDQLNECLKKQQSRSGS